MNRLSCLFRQNSLLRSSIRPFCVSTHAVKELRERTGVSIGKCREALKKENGDLEAARVWLMKQGIAKAVERSTRVVGEGIVAFHVAEESAVMIELKCETDFVAKNELLHAMATSVTKTIAQEFPVEKFPTLPAPDQVQEAPLAVAVPKVNAKFVKEGLLELGSILGENIQLSRFALMRKPANGVVGGYVHNAHAPGVGRLAALVTLSGATGPRVEETARHLARQVVAQQPKYVTEEDVPSQIKESHRQILKAAFLAEQARDGKKGVPDEVLEKIVQGKMVKLFEEEVLYTMEFLSNSEQTVSVKKMMENLSAELGTPVKVDSFALFGIGLKN